MPVQDGVQTVKSHGIRNSYYIMYGTQIASVLLRRTQIYINLLCFSFFLFPPRFQWDLVCDRKHLKAMTQTVFMGGLLVGSVAFSALSDHVGRKIVAFLSIFFLVSITERKKEL